MTVNDLFKRLIVLSGFCSQKLSKEMLNYYDDVLKKYGYDKACYAVERIIKLRRGRDSFPSPADIEKTISPQLDPDEEAREAASRIIGAINRYGQYNTEKAKGYIGDLGWAVVSRLGGWMVVCSMDRDESTTTLQAQLRDLAKAIYNRSEKGIDTAPSIPQKRENSITRISEQLKQIQGEI
jgi:hypothetical protein